MGLVTEDMKRVIESTRLAFVATVNADGTPNLSPKSSLAVLGEDRIGFADIASPNTVREPRGQSRDRGQCDRHLHAARLPVSRYRHAGTAGKRDIRKDRRTLLGRKRQGFPDPWGGQYCCREGAACAVAGLHLHRGRDRSRGCGRPITRNTGSGPSRVENAIPETDLVRTSSQCLDTALALARDKGILLFLPAAPSPRACPGSCSGVAAKPPAEGALFE